jgi:NAD(P)-dependent dehydrogenase (short-subunit alcohol dehydrogenase family)
MSDKALAGKTAIVTGASSGLGVAFAKGLGEAGANVVLAARRADRLEALAAELARSGTAATPCPCDVTDVGAVEALVSHACDRFGRVDVLVNGAGVVADATFVPEKVPPAAFEQTVRVNLLGTWYGCQSAARRMLADGQGGSIVNIASIAGLGGVAGFPPAYQATKAAVIHLTRSLACSWADRGVRVNAISPGWFPSEMTDAAFEIPAFKEWTELSAPMGRIGDPSELLGALLFLASDASRFVTGHNLVVDGGLSASFGRLPRSVEQMFASVVVDGLGQRIEPGRG